VSKKEGGKEKERSVKGGEGGEEKDTDDPPPIKISSA